MDPGGAEPRDTHTHIHDGHARQDLVPHPDRPCALRQHHHLLYPHDTQGNHCACAKASNLVPDLSQNASRTTVVVSGYCYGDKDSRINKLVSCVNSWRMPGMRRSVKVVEHAGSRSPARGMSGIGISMTTMRPGVVVRPYARGGGGVALGAALFSVLPREEGWRMRAPVRAEADGGGRPAASAMKEDKENARPKEKRGGPLTSTALGVAMAGADAKGGGEPDKLERPKEKKETLSKVVIRRLPPSLTKEQLEEHLQPLPEHDYFEFFANDSSLYPHMFSRAYINFKNQEDIVLFRDRFDGYVFVDHKGLEYPAIVEFAPFQKAAKKKSKKKDAKAGTIEDDPEYKKFLESYSADDEKLTSTPETLLEEIEARNKELIAKKTTPLLNFLKNKQRLREEKREERRRRELERKRQREEERRKWKEEERRKRKEAEKTKKVERCPEKERDRSKDEPKIKLLKKPEKDERDFEKKEKAKKLEKESLREEKAASAISSAPAKRSDGEVKEEKAKKLEDDCGKDYREREYDRDREYERMQRERDKLRRQEDERRRQKERFEKEKVFRRKEEDMKKERDCLREKGKRSELTDYLGNMEKPEKVTKEDKKEDMAKRDRIRNKDRPAMQLYQPGARSRSRLCAYDESSPKSPDQGVDKKLECETMNTKEED